MEPATQHATREAWSRTPYALSAGLALGVLTMYAQGWLPGHWNDIANSGATWALGAVVVGMLMAGRDWRVVAIAGALVELGLVVGYYGSVVLRYDQTISYWAYVWSAVACIAGPMFSLGGMWLRQRDVRAHVAGLGLTGGVFVAEGIVRLLTLPDNGPVAWTMIGLGVLTPLVLGRGLRGRLYGGLALIPAVMLGLLGFAILDSVTQSA